MKSGIEENYGRKVELQKYAIIRKVKYKRGRRPKISHFWSPKLGLHVWSKREEEEEKEKKKRREAKQKGMDT